TTIAEDGTYSFDLAPGTVVPEEVLSLVGSDETGNIGEAVTVTVPEDSDAPDETPPVIGSADIDGNSTDGYTVTGDAQEPGDTIEVRNEAGEPVGSGIIGEDGSYTVDIEPALVSENETLYVVGVDEAGNESEPTEVVVPE